MAKSTKPLYSLLEEWADVQPLEQYEKVNPLAPIFYTEEYKDATSYFRGIVKSGEMSPRVLDLTEHIIRLNPAHYTAWYASLFYETNQLYDLMQAIQIPDADEHQGPA